MPRDKRFGQRPVEPLNLGIHFGRARIDKKVSDALLPAIGPEMIRELRTIVRLHVRE